MWLLKEVGERGLGQCPQVEPLRQRTAGQHDSSWLAGEVGVCPTIIFAAFYRVGWLSKLLYDG